MSPAWWIVPCLFAWQAPAPEGAATASAGPPPPLIPERMIREGDERPLELLQASLLGEALEAERHALDREAAQLADAPDTGRAERIENDRELLDQLEQAVRREGGEKSRATLPPIDHYLLGLARDRLRTLGLPLHAVEEWIAHNREWMESGSQDARDRALEARALVVRYLTATVPLRRLIATIENLGPLTPQARLAALATLKGIMPAAPLPSETASPPPLLPGLASTGPTGPGKLEVAPQGAPPQSSLPRIDGVEAPRIEIGDLSTLLRSGPAQDD